MVQMPTARVAYLGNGTLHGNAAAVSKSILLTNILFSEDVDSIEVRDASGHRLQVRFMKADPCLGVMFLKVVGRDLEPLPLAPDGTLRFGQQIRVACIPNLRGSKTQLNLVAGVVSGMHRFGVGFGQLEDYLQIDSVVPDGSYGAPVLDLEGRLVGIYNGAAFMPIGYRSHRISGINLANSTALIPRALAAAESGTTAVWTWLGLQVDVEQSSEHNKLVVQYVYPGVSGFKPGDEIVRIGEQEVRGMPFPVLQRTTAELPEGTPVSVQLRRQDKMVMVEPEVMRRPAFPRLSPLDAIHWVLGIRISSSNGKSWAVDKVSARQKANGVLSSDTVQFLNGEKIKSAEHLAALVEESYGDHALSLALTLRSRGTGKSHPTYQGRAYYRYANPSTL